jgi:hypothetical protein
MIYENPNWIKLNWKNFVWVACIVFLNWAVNLAYLVFNSNSLIKIWWLMLNVTNAYLKKVKNKPYPLILFPTALWFHYTPLFCFYSSSQEQFLCFLPIVPVKNSKALNISSTPCYNVTVFLSFFYKMPVSFIILAPLKVLCSLNNSSNHLRDNSVKLCNKYVSTDFCERQQVVFFRSIAIYRRDIF